jgi:AmmeMemoRadiSam system protein A
MMMATRELGGNRSALLRYANSGDTPFGEREQVVGYGALMIWQGDEGDEATMDLGGWGPTHDMLPIAPLQPGDKDALLELARSTLERYLAVGDAPIVRPPEQGLWQKRGAFVTLEMDGELRGCIGELIGRRPLYLSVQWAALSAALADRRFPSVTAGELSEIEIEISALTEFQEVADVADIQVGADGLVISKGDRQGVLLPQVPAAEGWDREEFLRAVCRKAGLPEDAWQDDETTLYAFRAEVFREH